MAPDVGQDRVPFRGHTVDLLQHLGKELGRGGGRDPRPLEKGEEQGIRVPDARLGNAVIDDPVQDQDLAQ